MPRKNLNYTREKLKAAIEEVKKGGTVAGTAKKYGIPRITLMYKVNGQLPEEAKRTGPAGLFTEEQEAILVNWIISMGNAGFPVTKQSLIVSVQKIAESLQMKRTPGIKWFKLFINRHQEITDKVYQTITKSRTEITREKLSNWFREAETYIRTKGLDTVVKEPRRVFNADEASFYLNPKAGKVLAERGSKAIYLSEDNEENETVTVLLAANAEGTVAPPMLVYRCQSIPLDIVQAIPKGWAFGRSENGWVSHELFYDYITNVFKPWLEEQKIQLPVVLFLDGHASHISYHLSSFCIENGIELVALYPNANRVLQPMDVAVFQSFKASWRKCVQEWRLENPGEELKKRFPSLLQQLLSKLEPSIIINGFRKCGLVPWSPDNVCKSVPRDPKLEQLRTAAVRTFLEYLEQMMGTEKLARFQRSSDAWQVPVEDRLLFEVWSRYKTKLVETPQIRTATTKEDYGTSVPNEAVEDLSESLFFEFERNHTTSLNSTEPVDDFATPGPSGLNPPSAPPPTTTPKARDAIGPPIPSHFKKELLWPHEKPESNMQSNETIKAEKQVEMLRVKEEIEISGDT